MTEKEAHDYLYFCRLEQMQEELDNYINGWLRVQKILNDHIFGGNEETDEQTHEAH